ncbi:MAG TPA: hypothetical protein VJT71_12675 [Pyrinomonadaceae bacterium]|nr:hypothetical protein [Pyrinomonadaceae bacterium]
MSSNICRQVRREIDELDKGRQPGESVRAHLDACSACAQFSLERANLRELIGGLESVVAPADFEMRLRARLARENAVTERQPFFARLIGVPAIAVAALVVMAIATVVWVGQKNTGQPATASHAPAVETNDVAANRGNATTPVSAVASNDSVDKTDDVVGNKEGFSGRRIRTRANASRDYGVIGAETLKQNDSFVNAPSKPMVVSLEDEAGAKRKISLPPVSFGAQGLVDNRTSVSYNGNSRVW